MKKLKAQALQEVIRAYVRGDMEEIQRDDLFYKIEKVFSKKDMQVLITALSN